MRFNLRRGVPGSGEPEGAYGPFTTEPSAKVMGEPEAPLGWFGQLVGNANVVVPQKLLVSLASRKVALPDRVKPLPNNNSKLDSMPRLRADAAFCTTVTLFGPR